MMNIQDKQKCIDCLKNIKKLLINNGYKVFEIDDENILCRTPKNALSRTQVTSSNYNTSLVSISGIICPANSQGVIDKDTKTCTCSSCSIHQSNCPLGDICNGSNNSSSDNNTSNNTSGNNSDNLFRVKVSDNYFGINVHAIILRGEMCELKMSFDFNKESVQHVVDVIEFLI